VRRKEKERGKRSVGNKGEGPNLFSQVKPSHRRREKETGKGGEEGFPEKERRKEEGFCPNVQSNREFDLKKRVRIKSKN